MCTIRSSMASIIRKLISPSLRFELRQWVAWLREKLNKARIWRWEIAFFTQGKSNSFDIIYAGQKENRKLAQIILGINNAISHKVAKGKLQLNLTIIISEITLPRSLCVPQYLRAIVPLGRTIDDITLRYDSELRRNLRKHRSSYRLRQALSDTEIEHADREMLQPYARARHGSDANQIDSKAIRRYALGFGRLDLVLLGNEVVACLLAYELVRKGKRYWVLDRFGYPEAVFSDPKRLREVNSINNHLALEWAIDNGFDYYDIALCFGHPDDGLLQWKRRRGAEPTLIGLKGYGHFYVKLPKTGRAQFLWDNPLFAIESKKLSLHLGLPGWTSDSEFIHRYRQMGFGGLSKVYLHCEKSPSESLLETLRSFYTHQNQQPIVMCISSN
jgi:hypothetical protein